MFYPTRLNSHNAGHWSHVDHPGDMIRLGQFAAAKNDEVFTACDKVSIVAAVISRRAHAQMLGLDL